MILDFCASLDWGGILHSGCSWFCSRVQASTRTAAQLPLCVVLLIFRERKQHEASGWPQQGACADFLPPTIKNHVMCLHVLMTYGGGSFLKCFLSNEITPDAPCLVL